MNKIDRSLILLPLFVLSSSILFFGSGYGYLLPFAFLGLILLFANYSYAITLLLLLSPTSAILASLSDSILSLSPSQNLKISLGMTYLLLPIAIAYFTNINLTISNLKRNILIIVPSAIFLLSFMKSQDQLMAIFMSGDSRNHSLLIRNIVKTGFVSNDQQAFYPSYYFHIAGTIANGIGVNSPIKSSVIGLIIGYIFACLAIVFSLARLSELYKLSTNRCILIGIPLATSTYWGFILMHGFYSAAWGLAVLIPAYVNLFTSNQKTRSQIFLEGSFFALLAYHAWALLPPLILLPYLISGILMSGKKSRPSIKYVLPLIFFTVFSYVKVNHEGSLERVITLLKTDGGISDISFTTAFAIFLLLILILKANKASELGLAFAAVFVATLIMFLTIGFLRRSTGTFVGYYNQKLLWIITAAVIPILVIALISLVDLKLISGFSVPLLISAIILFSTSLTPLQNITLKLQATKWSGPSPNIVEKVFSLDNSLFSGKRIIFWYFEDPGNDRIGTFWSSSLSNEVHSALKFNEIAAWAYSETGQVVELCSVLSNSERTLIVTRNKSQILIGLNNECAEKVNLVDFIN